MKLIDAEILENRQVLPGHKHAHARGIMSSWLIWLRCPDIAREAVPGQFVMVRCGPETTLPRPFSVHQADGDRIALLYAVREDGRGTEWLSRQKSGTPVSVFGPLGNGFAIHPEARNLLLVAGGIGIAPLRFLADKAKEKGKKITMLMGAFSSVHLLPAPTEPPSKGLLTEGLLPWGITIVKVTEDGSEGNQGLVTQLLIDHYIDEVDQIFACGPLPMYHDMFRRKKELKLENKSVQISLEVRMGCGVGVCYGCTIKTKKGLKQACKDGPVFELNEILWDELPR